MKAEAIYPRPNLTDNARTVEFLLERSRDEKEREEIVRWGKKREARLPKLSRLVGLLEERGIITASMSKITRDFVVHHCAAIAAQHGLDMGYRYRDSMFGPLATQLTIDLYAVRPVRPGAASGLFGDDAAEAAFLAEVAGKDPDELGRVARVAALPPSHRIWE